MESQARAVNLALLLVKHRQALLFVLCIADPSCSLCVHVLGAETARDLLSLYAGAICYNCKGPTELLCMC